MAISAYWGLNGSVLSWEGMTVYPGDEAWGNRLLPMVAEQFNADLVITLMDVWVLTSKALKELPLACWVPVDHEPCPPSVIEFFKRTGARPIAMSRFGERMLAAEGLAPLYVPHGVDTKVFRPRPDLDAKTRERMGLPVDAFVVGMVAANQGNSPPRKAFPQVLQAFKRLRDRHKDAYLYLHTNPSGGGPKAGVSIPRLADQIGLTDDAVRFTAPLQLELGMPPEQVASLFSAFDVLANPSYGEGFGIPIVEAQSCGTKVIVTDCTAMTELCGDGWTVDGDDWYNAPQGSFFKCPSVDEIEAAMLEAYDERGHGPSVEAREFALGYDADRVTREHWVPVLDELLSGKPASAPALAVAA